jgi:hypothetical protein
VDEWLRQARDKLAAATGEDPSVYESGERSNAPLLGYVGVAHGRRGGELSALVDAAVGSA